MWFSNAFGTPQLAQKLLAYTQEFKETQNDPIDPDAEPSWETWIQREKNQLLASVAIDMWSFGTLLYKLAMRDAPSMFLSTEADNIVKPEDLQDLAYCWELRKLDEISRIRNPKEWLPAADLALWCLQTKPERRPSSFAAVLAHPFISGEGSLHILHRSEEERATKLHQAIEDATAGDGCEGIRVVFAGGGVHVNMARDGSLVLPIHRAARLGRVDVIVLLLAEVEEEAWPRVLNTQTEFGYTALHWCAVYCGDDPDGRFEAVADKLVIAGADTSIVNSRGKSPWELALHPQVDAKTVQEIFQRHAESGHDKLSREQKRRAGRPDVVETFRDDLELDHLRFTFWDIDPFSNWGDKMIDGKPKPFAEGGFGKIYLAKDVLAIEVKGKLFTKIALKVPKQFAQAIDDLKGEVVSLGPMAHPNVVQILGMVNGPVPDGGTAWSMALEFCETDLGRILYTTTDEAYEQYSLKLMVNLTEQIACGLVYIHGEGKAHLDLKPENVLVAKEGGRYVSKLADFGMAYTDDEEAAATPNDDGAIHSSSGSAKRTAATSSPDKIVPYGTWEYMAPEGWKRTYGMPSFESDIFSLGMMLWEMVARKRIYSVFPGFFSDDSAPTVISPKTGTKEIDVAQIAERLAVKQQRPPAAWTGSDDLEHHCPDLLYKLMQACWVPEMPKRPTAGDVLSMLRKLPSFEEQQAKPELTYDDFLAQLGLGDRKEDLADYLEEDQELRDLTQMDEDDLNDDILDDKDLGMDDDVKDKFREAVAALRTGAAPAAEKGGSPAGGDDAAVKMRNAWATLTRVLGGEAAGSFGTLAAALSEIERQGGEIERQSGEIGEKDAALARLQEEVRVLRATQEATPPSRS